MSVTFLIIGGVGALLLVVLLFLGEVVEGLLGLDDLGGGCFSLAGLAACVGAFGFTAAIVLSLVNSFAIAIVAGLFVGLTVGAGAAVLTRRLKDPARDGDSTVRAHHLVGLPGRVLHDIPVPGFGQVRVVAHGQPTTLNAKADEPLPAGTSIQVMAVLSPTSVQVRAAERP